MIPVLANAFMPVGAPIVGEPMDATVYVGLVKALPDVPPENALGVNDGADVPTPPDR